MAMATQLARVQTPTPRLLALHAAKPTTSGGGGGGADVSAVRVVAQIRPTLLHYIRDGVLMCVIQSHEEICGVTQCEASVAQLVVATRSGALWLVRLPSARMGVKPLVLRDSTVNGLTGIDASARRIGDVPGAQQLRYLADLDVLVCTSLLVPTTVVHGLLHGNAQQRFEIEELEGERSTSLEAFTLHSTEHARLVSRLLGIKSPKSSEKAVVILQGDADGTVRCAVVDEASGGIVGQVKELVRLPESIHTVCPIQLEATSGTEALLVIGARGTIVLLSHGSTYARTLFGRFGTSLTSAAFLGGTTPSIVFSTVSMKVLVISLADMLAQLRVDPKKSIESNTLESAATELSHCKGGLLLCAHTGVSTTLSILTRKGRLVSMREDAVTKSHSLPRKSTAEVTPTDERVKTLLQDIGRLSAKSAKLQDISERADALLLGLHTTLQFQRLVQDYGISNIVTCSLRLKLVNGGWAMQSRSVQLVFALRFSEFFQPSQLTLSAMWSVQVTVRTTRDRVSSYGLPLSECVENERFIELDERILHQQDGTVRVSCDLAFTPDALDSTEMEAPIKREGSLHGVSKLVSFGIPVVQAKELHLVQLCEPVSNFPMNPVTLREQFTQDQVTYPNGTNRHGHEWWVTFFEDAAFTGIPLPHQAIDDASRPTPPMRVVTRVRCGRAISELGAAVKEEDVMQLAYRFFNIESDSAREQWRQACRSVNGRWWIGIQTFTGNLIVLRFATTETTESGGGENSLQPCAEVTAYASNIADLAAVRAVILNDSAANDCANREEGDQRQNIDVERASIALMNSRADLDSLAAQIADIHQKARSARISERRGDHTDAVDICQEELLQLLHRTSLVETRALELYWKTREVLGQHLTL